MRAPSETSRLSALERLRRVAAEAEGRTAPLGATPRPSPTPAGASAVHDKSKDDVLARLREELQRAEAKIQANASRASGKPVPASAAPAPVTPASVRRASPARKSPTRSSSPTPETADEAAPAEAAQPEEGPKAFDAPLSAVEKLRKALEDTHARLDDKKVRKWSMDRTAATSKKNSALRNVTIVCV